MSARKEAAKKVRMEAQFQGTSGRFLFKLQRVVGRRKIPTADGITFQDIIEIHPTAGKRVGMAEFEDGRPVRPSREVLDWAAEFHGWTAVFA